jgi:TMEM192 family
MLPDRESEFVLDEMDEMDEMDKMAELLPPLNRRMQHSSDVSSSSAAAASHSNGSALYLPTIWIQLLQVVLLLVFLVMCFVSLPQEENNEARLRGYSVRSTFHVAFFLAACLVQAFVHYFHRRARVRGYLNLYRYGVCVCVCVCVCLCVCQPCCCFLCFFCCCVRFAFCFAFGSITFTGCLCGVMVNVFSCLLGTYVYGC